MRRVSTTARQAALHHLATGMLMAACVTTTGVTSVHASQGLADADGAVTSARSDQEHFSAEMRAEGRYTVAKEGAVVVEITAKGDYHVNPQFPIKFKVDRTSDGMTVPKDVLRREDGQFDEHGGSFRVPFTPTRSGKLMLAGTVSLSVCNDKRCVMEKVPLDVELTVQ